MNQSTKSIAWQTELVVSMTKREILAKNKNSYLGLLWTVVNPLLLLAQYTLVFAYVFKARWSGAQGETVNTSLVLFSGIIIHSFLAEVITKAPSAITDNVNFVKKIVFPLHILPIVVVTTALVHSAIGFLILLAGLVIGANALPVTSLGLPLIVIPYCLFCLGLSWYLALLGVFVKDTSQITVFLTSFLLFLSPVFFPVSALPEALQPFIYLNPISVVVEQLRNMLLWGIWPSWRAVCIYWLIAVVVCISGYKVFRFAHRTFADVV
jgi:lipopolysaccharide transport system permease protein